jgi:hypothetical protein
VINGRGRGREGSNEHGRDWKSEGARYLGDGLSVGVLHGRPAPAQPGDTAERSRGPGRDGARASRSGDAVRPCGQVRGRRDRPEFAPFGRGAFGNGNARTEPETFGACRGVESPSALPELFYADRAQLLWRVHGNTW